MMKKDEEKYDFMITGLNVNTDNMYFEDSGMINVEIMQEVFKIEGKNMYYFFGAGNNCSGALKFFGTENVIAIIDNNETKNGTFFENVPVISFKKFQQEYQNETIIITAYIKSNEIINQLKKAGISEYFVCPYMQSGFWSASKIVNTWKLNEKSEIAVYEKNPISDRIICEINLKNEGCSKTIFLNKEERMHGSSIVADVLLVVSEENINTEIFSGCKSIFDLYKEMAAKKVESYGYLKKYQGIHKGQDCFILGNGPSLRREDLDKLHEIGAISMASNGIYRVFNDTRWRPDYYVIGDAMVYEKNKDMLPKEITFFMRDFYGNARENNDIIWYNSIGEKYYPGYPTFSEDLMNGVYGGRTVTYDMLQIAVYMGFQNIYLIGVDFSWGENGKSTHFYVNKKEDKMIRNATNYRDEIEHAYFSARKYADSHNINIYNATRGGNLEVFERKNLDDLF